MLLMITIGLWALIAGRITLSPSIKLKGRHARVYGAFLILASIPSSIILTELFSVVLPQSILTNDVISKVLDIVVILVIVFFVAYPFKKWQEAASPSTASVSPNEKVSGIFTKRNVISLFVLVVALGVFGVVSKKSNLAMLPDRIGEKVSKWDADKYYREKFPLVNMKMTETTELGPILEVSGTVENESDLKAVKDFVERDFPQFITETGRDERIKNDPLFKNNVMYIVRYQLAVTKPKQNQAGN